MNSHVKGNNKKRLRLVKIQRYKEQSTRGSQHSVESAKNMSEKFRSEKINYDSLPKITNSSQNLKEGSGGGGEVAITMAIAPFNTSNSKQ